jgi:predicted kinase
MKSACDKKCIELDKLLQGMPPKSAAELAIASHLRTVARTFIAAQEQRHIADYVNSKQWTRTEALSVIATVDLAFQSWRIIRNEDMAQDWLVSLLVKDR